VLNQLPDVQFYNPDTMKSDDRESFLEWYKTNVNSIFDFPVELLEYCRSDVAMTMTTEEDGGIDPFATCITIASACNLVFRTQFLRPATLGIIPAEGYRPVEKHSVKALQRIKYVSQCEEVHIQPARNGGEKIFDQYRVDCYYETKDGEKVAMECHGCFWYGCPKCYIKHTINTANKLSMAYLFHQIMGKKITH
jgi:hypothetical protein